MTLTIRSTPLTIGVVPHPDGYWLMTFYKENYASTIHAGIIHQWLDFNYPGLVATYPGTEEHPKSNGVSVTAEEIVVVCNYDPTPVINEVRNRLEIITPP